MKKYLIVIKVEPSEISTTIINKQYKIIAQHFQEIDIISPKNGWLEYDPIEIYYSIISCVTQILNIANVEPKEIGGITIANEVQSCLVWSKETGLPIYNAIAWNDSRTLEYCHHLGQAKIHAIKIRSGLVPYGQHSASKIQWIMDEIPNARYQANAGELLWGTLDTWIIWKLTNGENFITDVTNASKTMLMNLKNLTWDKELLKIFKIPESMCPEIKTSSEVYGFLNTKHILPFSHYEHLKIPFCSISGTHSASFLAQNCAEKDEIKISILDSSFIRVDTGKKIIKTNQEINSSVSVSATNNKKDVKYSLESIILNGGYVISWLKNNLKLIYDEKQIDWYVQNTDIDFETSNSVIFIPAFEGLSAPYYNKNVHGAILGLGYHTKREDVLKAGLESIAYQNALVIKSIDKHLKGRIKALKIDGNFTDNKYLMQFQSNISQMKVMVNKTTEEDLIIIGSSILGWRALGNYYNYYKTVKNNKNYEIYTPNITIKTSIKLMTNWQKSLDALKK